MKFAVILPAAALKALSTAQERGLIPAGEPCLDSYHGTYGGYSIWMSTPQCVNDFLAPPGIDFFQTIRPLSDSVSDLFWVEEKSVEDRLRTPSSQEDFDTFLSFVTGESQWFAPHDVEETVLSTAQTAGSIEVLYTTGHSALLAVNGPPELASVIHLNLPRFYKPILLPRQPLSLRPVPDEDVDRIRSILSELKYDSTVASIVDKISVPQMYNDIQFLTGEDGKSGIKSRHSFSQGILVAADWIAARINATGAECEQRRFLAGFGPNVICRYPSTVNTTGTVLLSAHYDSRGSFGSTRAPGGDDDGSGTTAILSLARTIGSLGLTFHQNVELVLFAGEEQGLYGSRYYSRELKDAGANITLMIQADMLAYHEPGEPAQLGLPDRIGTVEVAQLVTNISSLYSPELTVGYTSACCSDHQSFFEQGFASTQVFERAGPIADPMYHNSGDLSDREGYDLEQVKSIAKVQLATLLHAAGFDLPK